MQQLRSPSPIRIGIRSVLLLMVGMALTPGFFLTLQNYWQGRQAAEQNLRIELQTLGVLAQSGQQNVVAGVRNILETVASGPSVRRSDIRNLCFEFLANIVTRSGDYANIGFADAKGDVQCIARGADQKLNVADRAYFQMASQSRQFTIGGYLVGRASAAPAMGFSIPVYDYNNKFVGVAFATLNLQLMNTSLQGLMLRDGLRVDLVDAGGLLLGSTSAGFGNTGTPYPDVEIQRVITEGLGPNQELSTLTRGRNWVHIRSVAAPARSTRATGSNYVIVSADTTSVLAPLGERLLRQLLVLTALLAIGLWLAWRVGISLVARPVLALRQGLHEAATAPHRIPRPFNHRTRELHDLDAGLQDLVGKLQVGQHQVEQAQTIAGIGFYTLDSDQALYKADPSTRTLLGTESSTYSISQGSLEATFLMEDLHELRARRIQLANSGGELRIAMRVLRPDGELRVLDLFELHPMAGSERSATITGALQDVTERLRLQRMYALLGSVNQAVVFSRTRIELFSELCRVAVEVGEMRMAWVAGRDTATQTLHRLAVHGFDDGYLDEVKTHQIELDEGDIPATRAFVSKQLVVVDDISQVNEDLWWRTETLRRGYRSIAAIPLFVDGEVAAVVVFMATSSHYFKDEERRLLVALGSSVSNALEHQRLVRERERVLTELTAVSRSLIRAQSLARLGNWTRYASDKTATWSPGLYEILQRDPAAGPPLIHEARQNLHTDDVEMYMSTMELALAGRLKTRSLRYRCRRGDGQWRWFEEVIDEPMRNEEGVVLEVSGTVQDITEQIDAQKKLQLQLSRTELLNQIARATEARHDLKSVFNVVCEKLEAHFDAAACAVLKRSRDGDVLIVEHVGVLGRPAAEAAGVCEGAEFDARINGMARCVSGELVHEPDLAIKEQALPRSLVSNGLRCLVLIPLQSSGETSGLIMVARREAGAFSSLDCEFLRQLGEHVSLAASHARLIDSLQTAYRDLEEAQQRVLQQERLRLLGQMASGIAHDINNAISPVSLYVDSLLEREQSITVAGRKQLQTIQLSVRNVADTIARMREFYRPEAESAELVRILPNALVMQALELTKARWHDQMQRAGAEIDVVTHLEASCPPIFAVEGEVQDAVVNLLLNAVDAMPAGGRLEVTTRVISDASRSLLEISVSDTGMGMSEETRRRCLEPFYTTKGDQGSGMGLAMVFGCMKRHSGDVVIESEEGSGTQVKLRFEVADLAGLLHDVSRPAAVSPKPRRTVSVLLVDDDPLLLQAIGTVLKEAGHEVVAADNAESGLAAFEHSLDGRPFDIVLTDLGMPGLDGRGVALRIKAMSPETPVVMITGWGRRMEEDGEKPPHVDLLLSKPPQRAVLLDAIETLTYGKP